MCVEHTKEPWFLHEHGSKNSAIGNSHGYHITNAKGEIADIVRNVRLIVWEQITEADGRRIVACVNACAGIPTGNLETGGVLDTVIKERDEAVARCERLERELDRANGFHERLAEKRDKLLDALIGIQNIMGIDWLRPEFDSARAIIAEAEAR